MSGKGKGNARQNGKKGGQQKITVVVSPDKTSTTQQRNGNNPRRVQQAIAAQQSTRTRSAGSEAPGSAVSAEKFFTNMIDPKWAYLSPRVVPAEAVPHHYCSAVDVPVQIDAKAGAILCQPSLTFPLAYMQKTADPVNYVNQQIQEMHHINSFYQDQSIDFDSPLHAGSKNLNASNLPVGLHYNEDAGAMATTGRYYLGRAEITLGSVTMVVNNRGSKPINLQAYVFNVDENNARQSYVASTIVPCVVGATVSVPLPALTPLVSQHKGFGFGIEVANNPASDTTMNINLQLVGAIPVGEAWDWNPLPYFAPGADGGVYDDFARAEKFSTTGFSLLLSNTANELNRGGSIRAVQLPGGTRHLLPGNPHDLYTFLGNRNTIHKLNGLHLKDGVFWSYRPEKIQDFMFRKHLTPEDTFLYGDRELPYLAIAFQWTNEIQQPELSASLNMNIEYLTTSLVAPKFTSPVDTVRLMELWMMLGNSVSNVSHNPDHANKIREMVKDIYRRTAGNKEFRQAALQAGRVLSNLALGAVI